MYAFRQGGTKNIVTLKLEAGYKLDGWLDLLFGDILYYDFSDPDPTSQKFDTEWIRLEKRLQKLMSDVDTYETGLKMATTLKPGFH